VSALRLGICALRWVQGVKHPSDTPLPPPMCSSRRKGCSAPALDHLCVPRAACRCRVCRASCRLTRAVAACTCLSFLQLGMLFGRVLLLRRAVARQRRPAHRRRWLCISRARGRRYHRKCEREACAAVSAPLDHAFVCARVPVYVSASECADFRLER
jgi:hypothetical protein